MARGLKIGAPVMASYGMGKFLAEFLTGAFGAIVFKFYETEIGLSAGYAALATILYSLWNAINDPVIGYVTNRKAPLSRLLGRRFPWIIIGLLSSAVFFVLIFSVPESWREQAGTRPLPVFLWMVFTICLFDGCYSLWEVNYQSVYPDKFRSQEIRTKAAAISTAVGVLGVAAGFVVPPLFFSYGDVGSYLTSGWVVAAITVGGILLLIPGIHETKEMIQRFTKHQNTLRSEPKREHAFLPSMLRASSTPRPFGVHTPVVPLPIGCNVHDQLGALCGGLHPQCPQQRHHHHLRRNADRDTCLHSGMGPSFETDRQQPEDATHHCVGDVGMLVPHDIHRYEDRLHHLDGALGSWIRWLLDIHGTGHGRYRGFHRSVRQET